MALHIVCVRTGDKYPATYVDILYDQIGRNLERDFQFWCLTDDPDYHHDGITNIPSPGLDSWWNKCALFNPLLPWEVGDRIAYFDLDTVIIGRLDDLVDTPGIVRDWHLPGYNSSVMVWNHGEHSRIWTDLTADVMDELHGDQDWMNVLAAQSDASMDGSPANPDRWDLLPRDWCVSYRGCEGRFPALGTKVVCYHGWPKPHECDDWTKDVWKIGGLTEFPTRIDMNVSMDHALSNVKANCARKDVVWFAPRPPHGDTLCIVGGGPSIADTLDTLKAQRRQGARIAALNGAGHWLNKHGIVPDTLIIADARPDNIGFVSAEAGVYLLASQCDPSLFDAVSGKTIGLWHAMVCDEMMDLLEPYKDTEPCGGIGGGGTVGLRAINIAIVSGYRKVRLFGMDSCYREEAHHAYEQTINDAHIRLKVTVPDLPKEYWCSPFMIRQVSEFRDLAVPAMKANRVTWWTHGSGLLQDMDRAMKAKVGEPA